MPPPRWGKGGPIVQIAYRCALGGPVRCWRGAEIGGNIERRPDGRRDDPSGQGYLARLVARGGPDVQQWLELYRGQTIEPAIEQTIDQYVPSLSGREVRAERA